MVDLIIPCYNPPLGWEKKLVMSVLLLLNENFGGNRKVVHVMVVNDGSTKNFTDSEVDYLKRSGLSIEILANKKNLGKGYSVRKAVARSTAEFCVYTDLDLPFGQAGIMDILIELEKGTDVAVGARSKKNYFSQATMARKAISKSLMFFNRNFLGLPFDDTQAGIKGFNKKGRVLFLETRINRFLFDLEFLKIAVHEPHIRIRTVPVTNQPDLKLTGFGIKTIVLESVNLLIIIFKQKHDPVFEKDFAWN